jgi:hypothetical protein
MPNTNIPCPPEASIDLILNKIARGEPSQSTGIFDDDGVGILRPKIIQTSTLTENATKIVIQAALRDEPLQILYVGLRRNESARWRSLWPCALEFTGKSFRLHAHDIDDAAQNFPVKVFLLPRILDARNLEVKGIKRLLPETFVRQSRVKIDVNLRVFMNEALTTDQEKVARHELGVAPSGQMSWPSHSLYEFRRDNEGIRPSTDIVWPLLSRVDIDE